MGLSRVSSIRIDKNPFTVMVFRDGGHNVVENRVEKPGEIKHPAARPGVLSLSPLACKLQAYLCPISERIFSIERAAAS